MDIFKDQLMPLVRIAGAFALVWFYHGVTAGLLSGHIRLFIVIVLSILTWIVLFRSFSPLLDGDKEK